jgi:exodeoxyribonuclease V alpha subunit
VSVERAAAGSSFEADVTVRRLRFANPDSGWAVVEATDAGGEPVTLVGPLGHLRDGERASIAGRWVNDSRYGLQVKATQAIPVGPADAGGLEAFLRRVKHIGPKRAGKLIQRYGPEKVLDAIDADPARAFAAVGLRSRAAREASESWEGMRALRRLHLLLAPHGLAYLAARLTRSYGDEAYRVVLERPYELTSVFGVGFALADRIAQGSGCAPEDPERLRAGALHLLAENERAGSTCLPLNTLLSALAELLAVKVDEAAVQRLVSARDLVRTEDWMYRREVAELEAELAERVVDLLSRPAGARLRRLSEPETDGEATLTPEQRTAVRHALRHRLSLITGGPGTGKTATIRSIVEVAARHGARVLLMAPTGRAAVRMTEAAGLRATTVHSALGWVPGEGPEHGEQDPLSCELLIVDETSMANLELLVTLLRAVGPVTHVVLVGDSDQLAPVGAGKPFAELVATGAVPTSRLNRIFRQAAGSMIIQGAHAIRRGQMPSFAPAPGMRRDLFLVARDDPRAALDEVVSLVCRRLPEHFGVDPLREIQVFAPVYRGELGIDALNHAMREELNPDGRAVASGRLRIGDKVMLTGRNLHEVGLMNGTLLRLEDEVGREEPGQAALILVSEESAFRIPAEEADRLRLAYACSVHRGQGIELPVAVIVAHPAAGAFFLRREMLYTAVTRSRLATIIVGTTEVVARAARTADTSRRHSRLGPRIAELQAPGSMPSAGSDASPGLASPASASSGGPASSGGATRASSAIASASAPSEEIRS